jgi:tetratricopeptide (TPR) repeat protein
MLGFTLKYMGELVQARTHLEHSLTFYTSATFQAASFVFDPGVDGRCGLSTVLYLLGYPDQALQRGQEALTLARELAHPFSLAEALSHAARLHQYRGEHQPAAALEEASVALHREHGFAQGLAQEMVWQGWALVRQGKSEGGLAQIHQGLEALQGTGAAIERPWLLSVLARAYVYVGRAAESLAVLEEALTTAYATGNHLNTAGFYHQKGKSLLAQAGYRPQVEAAAEACWYQALTVARQQQAKILELQAAMSLSRLWQDQGKRDAARALLSEIYGWFTEGFDTAVLQEAKALLEELEEEHGRG